VVKLKDLKISILVGIDLQAVMSHGSEILKMISKRNLLEDILSLQELEEVQVI